MNHTTPEGAASALLTVTDITGRQVAAVPLLTAHCQLPTSNFANGVYFITVTGAGGASATKKLVIQN